MQVGVQPGVTFHAQGIATNTHLAMTNTPLPATNAQQAKIPLFTSVNGSMAELGIEWLDVLKMDIEGSEWEVFLEMIDSGVKMPFTQILMGASLWKLM